MNGVAFAKFIHIVLAVSLFALSLAVYVLTIQQVDLARAILFRFHGLILMLMFLAALTGTALVYFRHDTFHTLWIQAAYAQLAVAFVLTLWNLFSLKKKLPCTWRYHLCFWGVFLFLLLIVHDAVCKLPFVDI